ncbi:DNA/RNA non-specific endonuclease [Pseudochelatococcus lubricantis]|uniref:DNA/RNA non-specific endonuclease n=1 Tax=Pseudochelatococcus lubricantis TaxID=1538102 RepID=UPI0035EB8EF8
MSPTKTSLHRLRDFNLSLAAEDPKLAEEIAEHGVVTEAFTAKTEGAEFEAELAEESIVLRRFRPVLRILDNTTELIFREEEDSALWRARLKAVREPLDRAIRSVGRINLEGDGAPFDWAGTGWLVRENILVTNRHVAELFVQSKGTGLTFMTDGGDILPEIDFLQEFDSTQVRAFSLVRPLYVVPHPGPDIAFFEVELERGDDRLSVPITLASKPRKTGTAAVIGYPAYDSRIPDVALMEQIYGREYNKKRLAPGAVTGIDDVRLLHNCTTLGGNSGSSVLDLESGEALGLHFSGAFLRSNYAVRADVVRRALDEALAGRRPYAAGARLPDAHAAVGYHRPAADGGATAQGRPLAPAHGGPVAAGGGVTLTVPLHITVSLGAPVAGGAGAVPTGASAGTARRPADDPAPISAPALLMGGDDDEIDLADESRPEDYRDRDGYDHAFIGDTDDLRCPLPRIVRDTDDVLAFDFDGETLTELRYEHFSVVMKPSRRLLYFSAVNIDGSRPVVTSRPGWRLDPRIPQESQIIKECYGNPPRFSRGHMTRRKDPAWGGQAEGRRANADTMHVTNAAPQMQAFNSPIWLELEDYALENAIADDMRISVFTGPFFRADDPVFFGVQVPVSFWKVIAFVHDRTRRLSATGYRMNQRRSLPTEEEFVFGAFTSSHLRIAAQVSIRSIEEEAGLDFGGLADLDPLGQEESAGGPAPAHSIIARSQIRYF